MELRDAGCRGTEQVDPKSKTGKTKLFGCVGWQDCRTVCCPGQGDSTPGGVLFLGSAPDPEDDQLGVAFSGDGGQLFHATRDARFPKGVPWFATTVVRCFPGKTPNGKIKNPSARAMTACAAHLERTVAALRPRLIVTLGQYAAAAALGRPVSTIKVKKLAGRIWNSRFPQAAVGPLAAPIPVFAMKSPNWARRDLQANLSLWCREWDSLARYLRTGDPGQPLPGAWRYLKEPEEIDDFYMQMRSRLWQKKVSVDLETTGLDWWRGERVTLIGYGLGPEEAVVVKVGEGERAAQTIEAHNHLMRSVREVSFHNYIFDGTFSLGAMGHLPAPFRIWDTKALAYLTDENMPMSLEAQVDFWLPHLAGFKDETEDFGGAWADMPEEPLAKRCAYDCMATWQLQELFTARLPADTMELYEGTVDPALRTICRIRHRGWAVDETLLEHLRLSSKRAAQAVRERIENDPEITRLNGGKPLNPNSPQQVAPLLMRLGIDDPERMDNSPDLIKTTKEVLERHADEHWLVKALLEHGDLAGLAEQAQTYKDFTTEGRLFPGYNWGGQARQDPARATVTGRLSSAKPNVMNGQDGLLAVFRSRFEGGRIIQGDYSQLELRILAGAAGEDSLIEEFEREGGDPHNRAAGMVGELVGYPVTRQIGKRLNFGSVYGAGPRTLFQQIQRDAIADTGKRLPLTHKQVREMHRAWWEKHPAASRYMQQLHMEAVANGAVPGLFGQWRHVGAAKSQDPKERGHALRQLGNFPIQNGGALITLHAMAMVDRRLICAKMQSMVIGQLHDSIIVDAHPDEVEEAKAILLDEMRERTNERIFSRGLKVPLDVDLKIGYTMAGPKGGLVGSAQATQGGDDA